MDLSPSHHRNNWERGNCLNVLMRIDFYWWWWVVYFYSSLSVRTFRRIWRCSDKTLPMFKEIAPIFRYFCLSVPREFHLFEEINFVYPENTNTLSFYFGIIQTRTKCYCLTNSFVLCSMLIIIKGKSCFMKL